VTKEDLYSAVVGCPLFCAGIIRDLDTNIPRGFFTEANAGNRITLMVVGINPGQPMESEKRIYNQSTDKDKANAHINFARKSYSGEGKTFHRRLLAWLSEILEKKPEEVFREVVYTNLVKCTTPNNKMPSKDLSKTCFIQNLQKEILFWNPRVVVALGNTCDDMLSELGIDHMRLPHPSHREHALYHSLEAQRIKERLKAGTALGIAS
jgi:uracil-DNA glycosylase